MSAGTLTLTNNSDAVSGAGTAFSNELAAGDFIVVTVGGIPYTLPVKAINSNTSLTLVSNYTGPTQSGAAWSAIPRVAMNLVTAALVAQSAEALRGLNYDKQNWQSIFSGTGNVTVRLPDGSSWTGPAWSDITTALNGKADKIGGAVPIAQGGTGATTQTAALTAILGTSAIPIANGGTGATTAEAARTALGVAYGTGPGTVVQGSDDRLKTVDGKTGGTISGPVRIEYKPASGFPFGSCELILDNVSSTDGGSKGRTRLYNEITQSGVRRFVAAVNSDGGNEKYLVFDYGTGSVTAPGSFVPNSDGRIKTNKQRIADPLGKMRRMFGYTWTRLDGGRWGIGFIAQEIQEIFPDAVHEGDNRVLDDGTVVTGVLSPDTYGVSAALHHEAILALMDKNEAQQVEIETLKSNLEELTKIVEELIVK